MHSLFQYNWQVRDEWLTWCEDLPEAELLLERTGGVKGILATFVHIIDVEYSWLAALSGRNADEFTVFEYNSLNKVKALTESVKQEVDEKVTAELAKDLHEKIKVPWAEETFTRGEIINHCITHEIHHIGQLSVWAREIGIAPVNPNFIGRELFLKKS